MTDCFLLQPFYENLGIHNNLIKRLLSVLMRLIDDDVLTVILANAKSFFICM